MKTKPDIGDIVYYHSADNPPEKVMVVALTNSQDAVWTCCDYPSANIARLTYIKDLSYTKDLSDYVKRTCRDRELQLNLFKDIKEEK